MAKRKAFLKIVKENGPLVLDGAFGTELERHGCNIHDELWSSKMLIENPEIIKKVHISYLAAGADIIESSGYQATVAGFKAHGYGTEEALDLVKLSVRLAVQARNEFLEAKANDALTLRGITLGEQLPDGSVRYFSEGALPKPLVAASVGPYGAFLADGSEYRGDYGVQTEYLEVFHIPMIDKVRQVTGIGINCTAPEYVESLIKDIRSVTNKPIAVYPNLGETYDGETKTWSGGQQSFIDYVDVWRKAGANIIGGCCRTNPDIIQEVAKQIHVK